MSVEDMDKIFHPKSIAVIGAGAKQGSAGATLMHSLIDCGFAGDIHPINPKPKIMRKRCPYPDQYEVHTTTKTGLKIFIRPIRPDDAPLLVELFESLSPRSVYLRFFTPMKRLPHSMLAWFTQIDYDRHIALVALAEWEANEKMLGVARVITGRNPREAEFSVAVSDSWHGKGIGAALLQRCVSIAKERGIQRITGTILAENTQMLALGRKLGFSIKKEKGIPEYELSIDFREN
jgi:acetyltransferase